MAHILVIYCEHSFPKLMLRWGLSSDDKVCFPPAPTENLWMTAVIQGPSVATFRATIEQPAKAHTAFLRWLVGQILVQRPPDLPDLLLRPCQHE